MNSESTFSAVPTIILFVGGIFRIRNICFIRYSRRRLTRRRFDFSRLVMHLINIIFISFIQRLRCDSRQRGVSMSILVNTYLVMGGFIGFEKYGIVRRLCCMEIIVPV